MFEVNGSYVVKIPRIPNGKLRKEACVMRELYEVGIAPRPVLYSSEPEVLIYEKVDGVTAAELSDLKAMREHSDEVASVLELVHSSQVNCDIPRYDSQSWRGWIKQTYSTLISRASSVLDPKVTVCVTDVLHRFLVDRSNFEFNAKFIHGDIDPRNLIVNQMGNLLALIDWGEAMIGDPALDYAGTFFDRVLGEAVLKTQREEPPSEMLKRVMFYVTTVPLYKVVYGLEMNDFPMVEQGVTELSKALEGFN
ncbi:hypothetical protein HS1genome_2125 [Sulfodiicoccus acidiphilus]|uniref:Aminoglycoside phosphotransferase domain-containing protein n=1 Tax=Sulfodiicoccus acidiphilus TaxID=1670455 RepID=A0A348B6D4_9CREN|nr:hypothetical protein HS1genome_2125 [Sulfodiicoccus acidiphilus]GGT97972.1 hypothetical protein GCM10007116_14420 [Sulfodiicoccus acidiphilus]